LASGFAKGASVRGKRIAFGDGTRIIWDLHSEQIFRGNPNVAPPGTEKSGNIEWFGFYKGNRLYNRREGNRWCWNYEFKAIPGEVFLTKQERAYAETAGRGFVVIEPNVPEQKSVAPNKQWPVARYSEVAEKLKCDGYDVVQFSYGKGFRISAARQIISPTFRHAVAILARAALYIGPEGGLHHAAAAVGAPGVVMFGGFIPPAVTGYSSHTNLTGGAEACGSLSLCKHCKAAMDAISVDEVLESANGYLKHDAQADVCS
jgi:ADP-heptose:LPS heptosyltransferase